ncbi:bL17 family ribosomal protein [Patescibacteria group bacterium]|nr:bL17 family ribosomal protein [Patescibacteria group bacterium]
MRHHNINKKFGRVRNQRKALLRSLAISLVENESIKTTEAKAKSLRPFVEKLITRGKKDSIFTKRLLIL